jgi:CRISPR-associated protein Cmr4
VASKTFLDAGALGLYTETPLHCGAEGGTGYVDLPIQRERHTLYPVIPGSTLKGVLRDELKDELGVPAVEAVFGTEDAKGPGSVSFGDGVLAALPVRSSHAPFHWVTCPFVLERVFRLLGKAVKLPGSPGPRHAWARQKGQVLLEELRVDKVAELAFFADGEASGINVLLGLLPGAGRGFEYTRGLFRDRFLILSDEDFKELAQTATDVVTRIKLNAYGTTRTITKEENADLSDFDRQGNLFVEEVLPPESLFVAALRGETASSEKLRTALAACPVIRLGGDETIGRGVTHVTFVPRNG